MTVIELQEVDLDNPKASRSGVRNTRENVEREMPKDHFIWSLCCFLFSSPYCFCCLGLAALVHSVKARDSKVVGDIEAARGYGSTAQTLNIISTVIFCLFVLVLVITVSLIWCQAGNVVDSMMSYGRGYADDLFSRGHFFYG